jgi:hypothetical protein
VGLKRGTNPAEEMGNTPSVARVVLRKKGINNANAGMEQCARFPAVNIFILMLVVGCPLLQWITYALLMDERPLKMHFHKWAIIILWKSHNIMEELRRMPITIRQSNPTNGLCA